MNLSQFSPDFLMYRFKVELCARSDNHDWARCPFAHAKEKARRRDPTRYTYASQPCPDTMQGRPCPRGDACRNTHSVQEYWLHPERFRTQMCKNGATCTRPLCFFAHRAEELRFPEAAPPPASAAPPAPAPPAPAPRGAAAQITSMAAAAGLAPQMHMQLQAPPDLAAPEQCMHALQAQMEARQAGIAKREAALQQQRVALALWLQHLDAQDAAAAEAAGGEAPASPMCVAARELSNSSSVSWMSSATAPLPAAAGAGALALAPLQLHLQLQAPLLDGLPATAAFPASAALLGAGAPPMMLPPTMLPAGAGAWLAVAPEPQAHAAGMLGGGGFDAAGPFGLLGRLF
ncbi:MAG: hypothetical protein J3K34DRAFT_457542 [Monoraphidium minutum]|nr:MAG: hypothetical protein J3K34DRAFT_457542 [Monoraphidium minutum]